MAPDLQKIRGCLVGTLLGDALGAPHEGGLLEHAHPLGIDGARIMAAVPRAAVIGTPPSASMAAALCGAFRTDSYFPPQNLQGVEGLKEMLNVADQIHKRFAATP